ncbi:hypothetical protein HanIR_Chr10g0482411 [Helianthus annuus]|nr:hypothetical protein HanIR_Chr10g0482411 [Helianthus annuus]
MTLYTSSFSVGSSKNANLLIKDISAVLCSIKLNEVWSKFRFHATILGFTLH